MRKQHLPVRPQQKKTHSEIDEGVHFMSTFLCTQAYMESVAYSNMGLVQRVGRTYSITYLITG